MVLQAHSLLENLKHKSKNLKIQKRKKQVTLMAGYLNQSRFLKQRRLIARQGGGLVLYLVLWPAVYSLQTAFREVETSLKWRPRQSELKSDTCTKKVNCKGYTAITCLW